LNLKKGTKTLDVSKIFKDGEVVHDAYSNQDIKVTNGKAKLNSDYNIVLLERK
jgi:alpha-amylase